MGGCAWWVHILYRAPGDERDLYRLSIDDSINIWSVTLVWDFGAFLWNTQKISHFVPYCSYGPKWSFLTKFQVKISQRVFPVQKRSRYGKTSKMPQLSKNVAKKDFSHRLHTQNHKRQNPKNPHMTLKWKVTEMDWTNVYTPNDVPQKRLLQQSLSNRSQVNFRYFVVDSEFHSHHTHSLRF